MSRRYSPRYRGWIVPPRAPLPRCVAAWTDAAGLDRYRALLVELGWGWQTPQQKENAA